MLDVERSTEQTIRRLKSITFIEVKCLASVGLALFTSSISNRRHHHHNSNRNPFYNNYSGCIEQWTLNI